MNQSKFKKMSFDEMAQTKAGWKLFGKETVSGKVHGSIAGNAYATEQTTYTYVFGIRGDGVSSLVTDGWD